MSDTTLPKGLGDTLLEFVSMENHKPCHVSLVVDEADDCSVSITWGYEAPDSPMAAAQALGYGETVAEALEQAFAEARIYPCATCGWEHTCGDPPGEDCHS